MRIILGGEELGLLDTTRFQSALTSGTCVHYSSNLTDFFKSCTEHAFELLATIPMDIAR